MKNLWLLIGSLTVTLIAVIAVAFLFTQKANAPVAPADPKLVLGEERFVRGKKDAKVTIVEFSDLQCPACKSTQPLVEDILKTASDGARLIYRQFPLRQVHKNALAAAKAAEAAAKQNKFWEMHDILFDKQTEWEKDTDPSGHFEAYAKEIGLKLEQYTKDVADKSIEEPILRDEADGNTLGVDSTPTFYVNNVKTPVEDLRGAVMAALEQ